MIIKTVYFKNESIANRIQDIAKAKNVGMGEIISEIWNNNEYSKLSDDELKKIELSIKEKKELDRKNFMESKQEAREYDKYQKKLQRDDEKERLKELRLEAKKISAEKRRQGKIQKAKEDAEFMEERSRLRREKYEKIGS